MTHTPGPWILKEVCDHRTTPPDEKERFSKVRITPYTPRFCKVYGENHEANARLIAAAPELLAVLRAVVQSAGYESGKCEPTLRELKVSTRVLDIARAAITRATGEAR